MLAGEELESQGIHDLFSKAAQSLDQAKNEEKQASEDLAKSQAELENLRRQSDILRETKDGLAVQLEKINEKLKGSLAVEQVSKLLCQICTDKLIQASKNKNTSPSILEDATISLSLADERQSVIDSVREYKELLSNQNAKPGEPSECLII